MDLTIFNAEDSIHSKLLCALKSFPKLTDDFKRRAPPVPTAQPGVKPEPTSPHRGTEVASANHEQSHRLRAAYYQVTKEVLLCFGMMKAQEAAAQSVSGRGDGTSNVAVRRNKLDRQHAMQVATQELLARATAHEEKLRTAIDRHNDEKKKKDKSSSSAAASNPITVLHAAQVPLSRWSGRVHYALSDSSGKLRGAVLFGEGCVADEVRNYWKMAHEAASRARLQALRNNDTAAFAEHVSLLKISTLLKIMERTHTFMERIGLNLKVKAQGNSNGQTALPLQTDQHREEGTTATAKVSAALQSSDEYIRFQAYVSSTKNEEFRLAHQVDVFVEKQPEGLRAVLFPQQLDGLRFLYSLHANNINGILADEMGVGKTIQTLAFLLHLKELRRSKAHHRSTTATGERQQHHPHLVLAPLSVVREWREACETFTPDALRVCLYQELPDPIRDAMLYDVVLLPVHAARTVCSVASRIQWGYIVVDEAHKAVSNLKTLTAQAILSLPFQRRLVLTGTPLNSDLQELWSLLYFLNPEIFSDADSFDDVFRRPFANFQAKEMDLSSDERGLLVLRLHQILRPFMLRRCKRDIDQTLRMTSHSIVCPLTHVQTDLLRLLRHAKRTPCVVAKPESSSDDSTDNSSMDEDGNVEGGEEGRTNQAVTKSSKVHSKLYGLSSAGVSESSAQMLCNHAFLLPFCSQVLHQRGLSETRSIHDDGAGGAAEMVLSCSGKFLMLHLLLQRLALAKRKAVIFTHWLDCVDLLREYMTGQGWRDQVEVLTGSTDEAERKKSVLRFRNDETCLFFILSIKAGGCGINLQTAHVVIMLDRDYTMTNEDQALARVYRVGQKYTVRALYLCTRDPAESRIAARAGAKNKPRQAIIEKGNYQVGEEDAFTRQDAEDDAATTIDNRVDGTMTPPPCKKNDDDEEDFTVGQCMTCFAKLWDEAQASMMVSSHPEGMTSNPHPHCSSDDACVLPAFVNDSLWLSLHRVVCEVDAFVRNESDEAPDAHVRNVLERHVPPTNTQEYITTTRACASQTTVVQDNNNDGDDNQSGDATIDDSHIAKDWCAFWHLLYHSMQGPPLITEAVAAAVENDSMSHDADASRARKDRRAKRVARRLQRLSVDPPQQFWMQCWEEGMEDEDEIIKLYIRTTTARPKTNKKQATPGSGAATLPQTNSSLPTEGLQVQHVEPPSAAAPPSMKSRRRGSTHSAAADDSTITQTVLVPPEEPKLTMAAEAPEEEMPAKAPLRRGRGRPRKDAATADDSTVTQTVIVPPEESKLTMVTVEAPPDTPTKEEEMPAEAPMRRGRGRPRKVTAAAAAVENTVVADETITKAERTPKRRRVSSSTNLLSPSAAIEGPLASDEEAATAV